MSVTIESRLPNLPISMPRLVPRLVKALSNPEGDFLMRPGAKSSFKLLPESSVSTPVTAARPVRRREIPDYSTRRTKSILLDTVNPVSNPRTFKTKKADETKRHNPGGSEMLDEGERLAYTESLKQQANPYREHVEFFRSSRLYVYLHARSANAELECPPLCTYIKIIPFR